MSESAPPELGAPDPRPGTPPGSPPRSPKEARELEHRLVLAEIDAIHRILGVSPPLESDLPPSPPEPVEAPAEPSVDAGPTPGPRGAESPYLDDRLAAAGEAAVGISSEFDAIQQRTLALGASVATLRDELSRASEELAFLRSGGGFDAPSERATESARPNPTPTRDGVPRGPRSTPGSSREAESPPYNAFTVARYNETVREVRRRRPTLFGTTLLLAAAISAVLVFLAYRADEAMPVWWLAGLPLVWMIPVPFFVVSFVATHRILSDKAFDLPEAT